MALVDYSDSEDEGASSAPAPPAKKRKVGDSDELPPLPTAFHDLYSSTVRTSTQDDPSLHAGRERVTPHAEGHWPTHVYLEWHPQPAEANLLSSLISDPRASETKGVAHVGEVHSLLHNELGVSLPLHISLSRPLVLKTEQRTPFLDHLKQAITASGVWQFTVTPEKVVWHHNEHGVRWFQVVSLQTPAKGELRKLLKGCNDCARTFGQPLLYGAYDKRAETKRGDDPFHISIAWTLREGNRTPASKHDPENDVGSNGHNNQWRNAFHISFTEVKVRIGQDVTALPLGADRTTKGLFT